MSWRGKKVLITGGLGFIGSSLVIRLVADGAKVAIVDPLVEGCGGNLANIEPLAGEVEILRCDIGNVEEFRDRLAAAEVIFNLAGEVSHLHSMALPERDLAINTLAQLRFLQACRDLVPGVRIVYAGTRQVYGIPEYLPVDETHPVNPVDFNGVHKYAATMYHLMLSRTGELDAVVLRLTNVYGPRMALDVPCQGFLTTYVRLLLLGEQLEVFGDGRQLRDPVYVEDVVEAFRLAGAAVRLPSRSYNVGGPDALSLAEIASVASRVAGVPEPRFRPFPAERKAIDIGSYHTDTTRVRDELGWHPRVRFDEGIRRTLAYYRDKLARYLDPAEPNPPCKLRHLERAAVQKTPAAP